MGDSGSRGVGPFPAGAFLRVWGCDGRRRVAGRVHLGGERASRLSGGEGVHGVGGARPRRHASRVAPVRTRGARPAPRRSARGRAPGWNPSAWTASCSA